MIGVDTNILIRLLARDNEAQFEKTVSLLRRTAEIGPLFVNPLVATEAVWILERRLGVPIETARLQVGELLAAPEFHMPERLATGAWSDWFAQRHASFFDVVIAATNLASGCLSTYTFDTHAARDVPGMELLA